MLKGIFFLKKAVNILQKRMMNTYVNQCGFFIYKKIAATYLFSKKKVNHHQVIRSAFLSIPSEFLGLFSHECK